MKAKKLILAAMMLLPVGATAQVTDRIVLGNALSEQQHGLITYCPDKTQTVSDGLLGQTARNALRFEQNPFCGSHPGIYGGEYSFVLRVDGTAQNYLTLRTSGSDVTNGERYWVQVDGRELLDYTRDAVTFGSNRAPGAFAYNTLVVPRIMTDGKQQVVVRVRSVGRYWGYAPQGQFDTYQRALAQDMPPVYAVYMSTNPNVELADEQQGSLRRYADAPASGSTATLAQMKTEVQNALVNAIKNQVNGGDFKPAYANNNFNVVLAMGYAYQRGVYGTSANDLAKKIRVAIDSLVYINNLGKAGADITLSAEGQTATRQLAWAGWGGLYGQQGMGMYLLWRAGKVTDAFLNQQVDLGNGKKTRREQWIEAFRESFDVGMTYSGRRYITNQLMESSHSVYGAALALYALDPQTYHNAPKLALRFMREAVGVDEWTGVPKNALFDGSVKDADGYPDYVLGDPDTEASGTNYWGHHFHAMTAKGNGREQGWTCTSCYGNMAGRITDMYIATLQDPYIGTSAAVPAGSPAGDTDILNVALMNTKTQAYFTYPNVDAKGNRGIIGESSMCWRNRYDPGHNFYASLMCGALADDEEVLGHALQAYKEGHFAPDTGGRLFPYYTHNYYLADAIDKLIAYAAAHDSDYKRMPSTSGEPDYVMGDAQDAVVAVKHGDVYLFVNFMAESSPLESGKAHLITPQTVKAISFVPEVLKTFPSGQTVTCADVYWNGNHKITYPDNPQMANGGMQYERPAYDAQGHYNSARPMAQYYQQLLGQYLVAQNCSAADTYALVMSDAVSGRQAVDISTGQTVTLSSAITLAAQETKVYYIASLGGGQTLATPAATGADAATLKARCAELLTFAQQAAQNLISDKAPDSYPTDAFMPFFRQLTMATYIANCGTATQSEVDDAATALEAAYAEFKGKQNAYDGCEVPGRLNYTKKISTTGSVQVKSATTINNARVGAQVFIPVKAAQTGDYIIKVRAKGHVADSYAPSLNIEVLTPQQYYDGTVALDATHTQQIAYNDFDYSTYRWAIHLDANQTAVLRYTFGGTSSTFTVDLSYTDVELMSAADKLQIEIGVAQALLDSYAGSELVGDDARQRLADAIATAQAASDSDAESAYNALVAAENTFKSSVTVLEDHALDLESAIFTNASKHNLRWPDGTKGIAVRTNGWSKIYVGRYDIATVRQLMIRTNIKSHKDYCYGLRAYAVPVLSGAAAITTTDQLNALSTADSYRIGTFYGDETVDGTHLKEGSNTWKVGPQRIFDLQKHTVTANETDFRSLWGNGAVVPMTGYTYNDDALTDVKNTFESEYNGAFAPTEGLCDIFFQYGATKWGEMTIDEVIVQTFKSGEVSDDDNGPFMLYPAKDMALRIGNSNQSGTGATIEVRENTADNHEYGFCGIMEFDLSAVQKKIAEGYTITDATLRLTDCSNNRSSLLSVRPFYSGWAEDKTTTYDANADYIKASIAGLLLTTIQQKRYGGKKAFELQGAATQVNPFPVSAYQSVSTDNERLITYLTDSLTAGKTAVSLLIGRDNDLSTQNCGFYTKDVLNGLNDTKNCAQYRWNAESGKWEKIDGTDNTISRTAAAMQFFGLTEAQFQTECSPLLTITLSDTPNDPTAISNHELNDQPSTHAPGIYTLSGQRVDRATRGIYIINGRKVVIK